MKLSSRTLRHAEASPTSQELLWGQTVSSASRSFSIAVQLCDMRTFCAELSIWPFAGMNKMVINHLDKLFVTSDTATIVTELEVEHPAAKLLVMAAKAQEAEIGDATNLVSRCHGGRAQILLRCMQSI